MFYSHEILGSRQYGVATIWWVATVGRRGVAKVISRKAVQEVQINKACEKIIDPGAPLALRLQSNLLYGVSRIYSEQCRYVLDDAARVKATMRAFYRHVAGINNETDPKAGKATAGQNLIPDDPCFNVDNFVMPSIDLSQVEGLDALLRQRASGSQGSSRLSQLSPADHSIDSSSPNRREMAGFDFLGSAQSSQRFATPASFGKDAQRPLNERLALLPDDEGLAPLDNDMAFAFDADGNLIEMGDPELPPLFGGGLIAPTMNQQVRVGVEGQADPRVMPDEGQAIMVEEPLPDAEALETQVRTDSAQLNSNDNQAPEPARRRRRRRAKVGLFLDQGATSYPKTVIRDWGVNYAQLSEAASVKGSHVTLSKAKSNAYYFTLGAGIANVGQSMALQGVKHPLAEFFTGDALRDNIFLVPDIELSRSATPEGSRRRPVAEAFGEEDEERRVRRKADDGEFVMPDAEMPLEMGRDNNQAVERHSSMVPWSRQGSSMPGSVVKNTQRSRSASVTSLLPKGSVVPDIERFSDPHHPSDNFAGVGLPNSSSIDGGRLELGEDDSQWIRAEVENAAQDFLTYAAEQADKVGRREGGTGWVAFDKLLVPGRHGKSAAAQGFYHVLSLATRSRVKVRQAGEGREPFGRIEVGVVVGGGVLREDDLDF